MQKKSFIRKTIILLAIQAGLLFFILLYFIFSSYITASENMMTAANNVLQIYGQELDNKIDNADRLLVRLVYHNSDYDLLQSENEADRYYASISLKKLIEESIAYDSHVNAVVIAESHYESCIDQWNLGISYEKRTALRDFTMECARKKQIKADWAIQQIGTDFYLYKMYVWQGKATGIFVSVDSFLGTAEHGALDRMTLFLADSEDLVWGSYGIKLKKQNIGETLIPFSKFIMQKSEYPLADGHFKIVSYISKGEILNQIRSHMIGLFFVMLCCIVFTVFIIRTIKKQIINPMMDMEHSMVRIENGEYTHRISTEYENVEFQMLKSAFNRLMDEIVGLKIKSYEKQIELQETELKVVRLQIKPHFFLNAMTTISSLSMQKKNDEIKTYIDALSKNIRYMFKSGLHTVTLGEEVRHVENYLEMQELKYPGCVFYCIDMEPELENWKIPQMLIHTIMENEYKYAVSMDSMLTILIKASRIEQSGRSYLSLDIEDDGNGYPKSVLDEFEKGESTISVDGTRVGLFSVRRMLQLMYEEENLFAISNIEPHGCMNHFLIPEEPVHEVKKIMIREI